MIKATGFKGLLIQISYDLTKNHLFESLCKQIVKVYGSPLSEEEAEQEIDNIINFQNRSISLYNFIDDMKRNWYPEISWPELNTRDTEVLTQEFKRIQFKRLTTDHCIDFQKRDQILSDPYCQKSLANWKKYLQRKNALQEFDKAWIDANMEQALKYIIFRIESITDSLEAGQSNIMQSFFRM